VSGDFLKSELKCVVICRKCTEVRGDFDESVLKCVVILLKVCLSAW
jgi:hypothetical protein